MLSACKQRVYGALQRLSTWYLMNNNSIVSWHKVCYIRHKGGWGTCECHKETSHVAGVKQLWQHIGSLQHVDKIANYTVNKGAEKKKLILI
jgi:hypothetical protein